MSYTTLDEFLLDAAYDQNTNATKVFRSYKPGRPLQITGISVSGAVALPTGVQLRIQGGKALTAITKTISVGAITAGTTKFIRFDPIPVEGNTTLTWRLWTAGSTNSATFDFLLWARLQPIDENTTVVTV